MSFCRRFFEPYILACVFFREGHIKREFKSKKIRSGKHQKACKNERWV